MAKRERVEKSENISKTGLFVLFLEREKKYFQNKLSIDEFILTENIEEAFVFSDYKKVEKFANLYNMKIVKYENKK